MGHVRIILGHARLNPDNSQKLQVIEQYRNDEP